MKQLLLGGNSLFIGCGSLAKVQEFLAAKVFIVTGGSSMIRSGVIGKIETLLQQNGSATYVYSGIAKNPDCKAVLDGTAKMRGFAPDLLIAVGGGSAIDAAKVMGLLYEYPEVNFDNIHTAMIKERKKLKFVAIPSTSGTGSEVTAVAVITFRDLNLKIGVRAPAFLPDAAILDAELTMTMPDNIVAETGMDAMTHAVECYINRNLDEFTAPMAKGAVGGLFQYLPLSYREKTLASREKVHHYQCLAGLAFSNVGLGMCHGIAHSVGGAFDLGHGLINAVALPYVLEFNAQDAWIRSQLDQLGYSIDSDHFIAAVKKLNRQLNIPRSLREAGISEEQFRDLLPQLAANSMKGSTRRNPVDISLEQMAELLGRLYIGQE